MYPSKSYVKSIFIKKESHERTHLVGWVATHAIEMQEENLKTWNEYESILLLFP